MIPLEAIMARLLTTIYIILIFAIAGSAQKDTAAAPSQLKVGDAAPDFTLTDTSGTKVKLSEFRGKNNVVLAFYIFAFTGG